MAVLDFMSALHKSTKRNYLERVHNEEFSKPNAAQLAKQFSIDYWIDDRRICYDGYQYLEGRWEKVARAITDHLVSSRYPLNQINEAISAMRNSKTVGRMMIDL